MFAPLASAALIAAVVAGAALAPSCGGGQSKPVRTKSSIPSPEQNDQEEALPEGDSPAPPAAGEGPIAIEAGDFWMGTDAADKFHGPKRKITLDAFELDRLEVTAQQYNACVEKKECTPARIGGACTAGDPQKADHPINCVTWQQAKTYCAAAGRRLPTEAEWERAARGTDERSYPWGEAWPPPESAGNFSDEAARAAHSFWSAIEGYDDEYSETAPAGTYDETAPSGAYDLAGNVMEWTSDYWAEKIPKTPAKNPKGPPKGEERVVKGSSYGHYRKPELALTYRAGYREDAASEHIGFRCAK